MLPELSLHGSVTWGEPSPRRRSWVRRTFVAAVAALGLGGHQRRRRRRAALDWTPGGGSEHPGPVLAHRVVGGDDPSVLLLHGLAGSGRYWGGAYDACGSPGGVLVPDLAGFGRSIDAVGPFDLVGHADAVAGLLEATGVSGPVVVGAHSFGTNVAVALAARHPGLVSGVVAFGPPWYADPDAARARLNRMGPMARTFALDATWSRRVCEWVCEHRELASRLAVATRRDLPPPVAADGVRHTWPSYEQTLQSILSAEVAPYLQTATVPIVVVAGDADGIADHDYLHSLATAGTIRLETWHGNHDIPLARGRDGALLITRLLRSVDA